MRYPSGFEERQRYYSATSRQGTPWEPHEDKILIDAYNNRVPVSLIARRHKRSELAINCRLEKVLGVGRPQPYTKPREMVYGDIGLPDPATHRTRFTTALEREILGHYFVSPEPFPRCTPFIWETIERFIRYGLLCHQPTNDWGSRIGPTSLLSLYIKALGEVPLPAEVIWDVA